MKKIVFTLVVLVFAAPALADVNITVAQVGESNEVIISFDASSETNRVRAFGLDIQLDSDANVLSVTGLSLTDYWVNPGTIQIAADGTITYLGTIAAEYSDLPGDTLPGPPDGTGVTLEAASLYAPVGPTSPNAPARFGDLASVIVSADCNLCITANVSRAGATGIVMEDPDEVVTVNYPSPCVFIDINDTPTECLKEDAPEYDEWVAWGKPLCWCYAKQCRGDINGSSFFGKPITLTDLNIFKLAFNIVDQELALVTDGICADLNHTAFFGKRVTLTDLNIFKLYFNQLEVNVPECDNTNYNFWETP